MRTPIAPAIAIAIATLGCVDEEEVCATYDGTLCSDLQATVEAQATTIAALEQRLAALEGQDCLTEDDLGGLAQQEDLDDLQGQVDEIAGDYVVNGDVADVVRLVTVDTNLEAADSAEIEAQLAWLDGRRIGRDATVTLVLTSDAYTFTEPLRLAHPDGGRLEIRPDVGVSPVLTFPSSDGIVVEDGTDIGYLGDIALVGGGSGEAVGLLVRDSASVTIGELEISGFASAGIDIRGNANLALEEGAEVSITGCGYGALVRESAYADLTGATSADNLYDGFHANGGGITAPGAESLRNGFTGFYANATGVIFASDATSAGNDDEGFKAHNNGYIEALEAHADTNGSYGYNTQYSGALMASGSFADGNLGAAYYSATGASLYARTTTASDIPSSTVAYVTSYNGYIYAADAQGDGSTATAHNDTTDFIYGL